MLGTFLLFTAIKPPKMLAKLASDWTSSSLRARFAKECRRGDIGPHDGERRLGRKSASVIIAWPEPPRFAQDDIGQDHEQAY
jgi:hypothetical protein